MITSTSNAQIKELAKLQKKSRLRDEKGIFLVEGPRMTEEIPAERIEKVYASESFAKKNKEFLEKLQAPEMQAANNYIRNGYYAEAMNVLEGIASADRAARWHYYAALASSGLGNNIRAQNEARTAVDMEPGNYEYQNLLDRLQNPGRAYSTYQQAYTQPGSRQHGMNFCLQAFR